VIGDRLRCSAIKEGSQLLFWAVKKTLTGLEIIGFWVIFESEGRVVGLQFTHVRTVGFLVFSEGFREGGLWLWYWWGVFGLLTVVGVFGFVKGECVFGFGTDEGVFGIGIGWGSLTEVRVHWFRNEWRSLWF
jgi:hypothetical protein